MSTASADQFLDRLRASRIVPEETLVAFLKDREGLVGDELRDALIAAKTITSWQAKKLGEGRIRGFVLGKYVILEPLGAGGMGSVYKARHMRLGNDVALKVVSKRALRRANALARFEREARVASQLQHPNIVRTFDFDGQDEAAYLVMELMNGESLDRIVQRKGPLGYAEAVEYIRQAASGIAYAHEHGCIHRDIKPSNLMKDQHGVLKVLDFGLARIEDDDSGLTVHGDSKLLGTVDYVAPEQAINSSTVDGRADLYSLGCTLYFMLSGHAPFNEGTPMERLIKHKLEEPRDIRQIRKDIPEDVWRLWHRMTRKEPQDRYAKASQIVEDCEKFLSTFKPGELSFAADGNEPRAVERIRRGPSDPARSDSAKSDPQGRAASKSRSDGTSSPKSSGTVERPRPPAAPANVVPLGDVDPLGIDLASVDTTGTGAGVTIDGGLPGSADQDWDAILAATSQSVALPMPTFVADGAARRQGGGQAKGHGNPLSAPLGTYAQRPAPAPAKDSLGPTGYSVILSIVAGLIIGLAIVVVVISYAINSAPSSGGNTPTQVSPSVPIDPQDSTVDSRIREALVPDRE